MDEAAKRRLELAALVVDGLQPQVLWPSYFGQAPCSEFELRAYLHGVLALPDFEHGHGTDPKGKEATSGRSLPQSNPRKSDQPDGLFERTDEDLLAALGAAGRFLLTPERAEEERLASLRETDLLHSGPEETFDRVVTAAREYFGVGAASLSLIAKDAQFFKSVIGPLREETPRQIALCTETIRRDSMLVINDTLTNEQFASNPLVVGDPYIRFYAGYPLNGPRGWNIGTLCVIDQKPRTFTPSDELVLRSLAAIVQNDIDARTLR
ncbi:hypothetical protein QF038_004115 [Pseudarthrobacter sp. W1I19]|uniref:GAF domain-containing protein n=1 Tax=Pseudarthrobacter sp. W1I19 TaxID=3042288 RepID=UPI0027862EA6|nr:GAF domain-containing protein [Pseudarthrobacter sp. W1I19]MDQ0925607.1 hypothetical protein [Pseudarthrobacter sp. W1I19]